jgi:acyl carrier protein
MGESRSWAALVAEDAGIDRTDLRPQDTFEHLGLDSLALLRLRVRIEEDFGVWLDETEFNATTTVAELEHLMSARDAARG